jgi:hypothetical protein
VERVQAQVKIVRPDGAVSQRPTPFSPTGKRCLSREASGNSKSKIRGSLIAFSGSSVYKNRIEQIQEGGTMTKRILARGLRISMILGVFALGFLLGTVNERYADAQKVPGVGDVLDKAGKSGGALGSVAQLGSSISEMQTHVNGLQKNLETLKTVQAALGGK